MYIENLKDIKDIFQSWPKAYNLGIALRYWINVPHWYIIFIKDIKDFGKNKHKITTISNNLNVDNYAVRSSSLHEDWKSFSFAWQYTTYLNVQKHELIEKVKDCFLSSQNKNVNLYKQYTWFKETSESWFGIIVQQMIIWDISGVIFTKNPISWENEFIVEWCYGLGENFVSWQKTDIRYTIKKKDIWKTIKVDKNMWFIEELCKIAKNLEKIFNWPIDIERTVKNNVIYILQIRYITTINYHAVKKWYEEKKDYVRMFHAENRPFLFSDIYIRYYKALKIIMFYDNNMRQTWLPKKTMISTLKKWIKLYSSVNNYSKFSYDLFDLISKSEKYFEVLLWKNNEYLTYLNIKKAFMYMCRFFFLYSHTEFFYTDNLLNLNDKIHYDKLIDKVKNPAREYFSRTFFWNNSYLNQLLLKISSITNTDQLRRYSMKEILDLIKNQKSIDNSIVHDRQQRYFIQWWEGHFCTWEQAQITIDHFLNNTVKNTDDNHMLEGIITSVGKVNGYVKVIKPNFHDYDKLEHIIKDMDHWSILVVESATPDLIYACKKASAIVTNQWWLLSHASIFCREFKIPCLVWVVQATEVLKDWDHICVDCSWWDQGKIVFL